MPLLFPQTLKEMKMLKKKLIAGIGMGALAMASLSATAEDVDLTGCLHVVTEVITHTPQRMAGTLMTTATLRSNTPNSSFDNAAYRCPGYFTVLDGKYYEEGYCEGVNPKGDRWLIFVSGDGQKGTWSMVSGTGAFDGVKGGGEYITATRFPEVKPGVVQLCHKVNGKIGK
jgi:hypothetical protein